MGHFKGGLLRVMAGLLAAWGFGVAALIMTPAAFAAEKHIALVIGNARYPKIPLNNPENDARLITSNLRRLGFEVTEELNLGVREFRRALRDFARRMDEADGVAVLYYAGHGVQIDGRNFLLPVDINLRDEEEVKDDSVDVDELFFSRIEKARMKVRIVVLDACRDNPFRGKTRNIRAAGGLAEMGARGTLIAYSSAPGAAAEDGPPGSNSLYTKFLAEEMVKEGLEIEQVFKNVRVKVLQETKDRQIPWVNTSLAANFSFNPGQGVSAPDQARQEQVKRLEDELKQTRAALTEAQAKAQNTQRLQAEVERAKKALEQANAAAAQPALPPLRPAAKAAPPPPAVKAEVQAPRPPAAQPLPPEPSAPPSRRGGGSRCGDLLHRASVGDVLSPDESNYLKTECR